ncbi:MAG: hypothetical protein AAFO91_18170, partial [Bacteroidota bacterium]
MCTYRNRAYKRGSSTFGAFVAKVLIAHTVGGWSWYKRWVRNLVLKGVAPQGVKDIFDQITPDLFFTPSLIDNEFDVQFAAEARRQSVPVVGMVRSWDNFNNHGLLAFVPDTFLLQNVWLKESAKKFQAIDIDAMPHAITGLPHYDSYYNVRAKVGPREVFLESLGIDPTKKVILLGGSDFYYSEYMLPKLLNDAVERGDISEPVHIIFRPHPASIFSHEDYGLDDLTHVTLDDAFSGKVLFSDAEKFNNLLCHADIIMNICSTLSIDASVVGTPAISVNFDDPKLSLSYHEQVGRLYDQFDHYEKL